MIAGAAAAQVMKEQMAREAHAEPAPARVRAPARPRLALAAAMRRVAARLERPVVAR